VVNGTFGNATPGFLFNTTTKLLSFDADGNGAVAPVAIATLSNLSTLSASDIVLI
jgi:serralysin